MHYVAVALPHGNAMGNVIFLHLVLPSSAATIWKSPHKDIASNTTLLWGWFIILTKEDAVIQFYLLNCGDLRCGGQGTVVV